MTPAASVPTAALVSVGDELLLGRTIDTNAAWLARGLADLGIDLVRGFTVGDDDERIRDAVSDALATAEVVLVTGGLGPTSDDRTRPAVAALLGRPLGIDGDLLAALEVRSRRRGQESVPERLISQAEVPEGATVLANPQGTAPGLALETKGRWIVLLPGVPREMKAIFQGDLRALLTERFGARLLPLHIRTFHTTGVPESELAGRVDALLPGDLGPLTLAFLPDLTGVDLRLTARGVPADEAERWFRRVERALAPLLGEFGFLAESGDLVEAVAGALLRGGRRLAVAESCTGGLLARRLTERAGSSAWFVGSVVAYANEVKIAVLGVDRDVLERCGAVSEEVVAEMARGAARALGSEAALAVTGIAGPEGGTPGKPVGTVWYAALMDHRLVTRREVFPGDRAAVRERSAQAALALLLRVLEGRV